MPPFFVYFTVYIRRKISFVGRSWRRWRREGSLLHNLFCLCCQSGGKRTSAWERENIKRHRKKVGFLYPFTTPIFLLLRRLSYVYFYNRHIFSPTFKVRYGGYNLPVTQRFFLFRVSLLKLKVNIPLFFPPLSLLLPPTLLLIPYSVYSLSYVLYKIDNRKHDGVKMQFPCNS